MRRDCPQRQGSQGFGTVQSQSSIGQARTQFIPPPQYGSKEPVSVPGCYTSTSCCTDRPEYGSGVEDRAHRPGHQGSRGASSTSYHRLSQRISQLYRVCFYCLAYGQEHYLILVHRIHSSLHQLRESWAKRSRPWRSPCV